MIDMTKLLGGWDIYGKGGATQDWLSDYSSSSGFGQFSNPTPRTNTGTTTSTGINEAYEKWLQDPTNAAYIKWRDKQREMSYGEQMAQYGKANSGTSAELSALYNSLYGGGDTGGGTDNGGLINLDPNEWNGGYDQGGSKYPQSYADLGTQYPYEWGTASDVLQNMAQHGYATEQPEAWKWTESDLNQIIGKLGMPTSYAPAYQAAKGVAQTDISDAIKEASEQAGLTGLRWSTPLGRSAQDIAGRRMAELGSTWTTQELGAQETAMSRMMDALQQRQTLGGAQAGLTEAAKGRALTAAGELPGLGSLYAQLPQQLANTAAGLGGTMRDISQSDLTAQQQESLRLMAENNPWLSMALGMSSTPGTQQTYTPGCLSQGLTGLFG